MRLEAVYSGQAHMVIPLGHLPVLLRPHVDRRELGMILHETLDSLFSQGIVSAHASVANFESQNMSGAQWDTGLPLALQLFLNIVLKHARPAWRHLECSVQL